MLKGVPQVRGRTPQQPAAGTKPQQQQPRFSGSCYACGRQDTERQIVARFWRLRKVRRTTTTRSRA
eukprot:14499036-Heterocapsa_arctica.AAC.1